MAVLDFMQGGRLAAGRRLLPGEQRRELSPEEEDSLARTAGKTALGGLSAVANVLDLPVSSVRDILAWKNPVDQYLTPFSDDNRTTPGDLLQKWGLQGRGKSRSFGQSAGRFAADVALDIAIDPLTYLTFGASALTKGGKALKRAGMLDRVPKLAGAGKRVSRQKTTVRDVVDGPGFQNMEKLLEANKGKPIDSLLDQKVGGMFSINIPGLDPIAIGGGRMGLAAGQVLDDAGAAVRFGKYSPVRYAAPIFSKAVRGAQSAEGQKAAIDLSEDMEGAIHAARDRLYDPLVRLEKAGVLRGENAFRNSNNMLEYLEGIEPPKPPEIQQLARSYDDLELAVTEGVPTDMLPKEKLDELEGLRAQRLEDYEAAGYDYRPKLSPELEPLKDTLDDLKGLMGQIYRLEKDAGVAISELDDPIEYFARLRQTEQGPMRQARDRNSFAPTDAFTLGRDKSLRGMMRGTALLQEMSVDQDFAGIAKMKNWNPDVRKEMRQKWREKYGLVQQGTMFDGDEWQANTDRLFDKITKLDRTQVERGIPMFAQNPAEVALRRMESGVKAASAAVGVRKFLREYARPTQETEEGFVKLNEIFGSAGSSKINQGHEEAKAKMVQELGEIADESRAEIFSQRKAKLLPSMVRAQLESFGVENVPTKPEDAERMMLDILAGRPTAGAQMKAASEAAQAATQNTRGQGVQYHGARGPIESLQAGYYSPDNIYGGTDTFYTTDAKDIAAGYGRKNPNAKIYQIDEAAPVNFYDMESLLDDADVFKIFGSTADGTSPFDSIVSDAVRAARENGGTFGLRQVMDEVRSLSSDYGLSKDDIQDLFDNVSYNLQQEGFGGMSHVGGLKTNSDPHTVKIYFDPENQVRIQDATASGAQSLPSMDDVGKTLSKAPDESGSATPMNGINVDPELAGTYNSADEFFGEDWQKAEMEKITDDEILASVDVPLSVAEDAGRVIKSFQGPEETSKLVAVADTITNWFKTNVTATAPSFHTRNAFSGAVQNVLGGAMNPAEVPLRYNDALAMLRGKTIKIAESFARDPVTGKKLTGAKATDQLRREIFSMGILDSPGQHNDLIASSGGSAAQQIPGIAPLGRQFESPQGTRLRDQANPFASTGVGSNVDRFFLARWGRGLGNIVEGTNRVSAYISLRKKGFNAEEAAKRVKELHVDYTNLTDTERKVMRRMFPFYSFTKGMVPFIARELSQKPGGALSHTIRAAEKAKDVNATTPQYVADTTSIPLGTLPDGSDRYITGLGLMHEAPLSLLSTDLQSAGLGVLGQMNPLVKGPLEYATGQSFFQTTMDGGRPLKDVDPLLGRIASNVEGMVTGEPRREAYKTPRALDMLAANSPASRYLSTVRQMTDPRKGPGAKAAAFFLGPRFTDISPAAQDAILREQSDAIMLEMGGRDFTNTYIPESVLENMSPEQRERAEQWQALKKLLTNRTKERAAAREK